MSTSRGSHPLFQQPALEHYRTRSAEESSAELAEPPLAKIWALIVALLCVGAPLAWKAWRG